MELFNFFSLIPHMKTFFGISVDEEDVEDIGLEAWEKIGNKNNNMYSFSGHPENCVLDLPCNVLHIEAVTDSGIPFKKTDEMVSYNYDNERIEDYVYRVNDSFFQTKGNFIDYELNTDRTQLIFKRPHSTINVLYKGLQVDEDGLPLISTKEKTAIGEYIAYVVKFKEGMMTNDRNSLEISNMLNARWKRSCGNARTTYVNQNDWDKILNAKTSWDRKRYNISYKPVY